MQKANKVFQPCSKETESKVARRLSLKAHYLLTPTNILVSARYQLVRNIQINKVNNITRGWKRKKDHPKNKKLEKVFRLKIIIKINCH